MHSASIKNRILAVFIVISAVLSLFVLGKPAFAENNNPDNFSAVLYNNSNGLPTSEANDIVQADDGFIYIGSYSGLIRYDGVNFMRFDSYTGITSVDSLFIDSKKRMWIGTNDSGLALYENGAFRFYNRENGLSSLSVRDITEDGAGNIIIGTTSELAYIDDKGELSVIDNDAINGKYIKQLTSGNDGAVYGCTTDGVFFRLENLEITASYSSEEMGFGIVSCITPDDFEQGVVWLGTDKSNIIRGNIFDNKLNYRVINVEPASNINSISAIDKDSFWICSDSGIGKLNRNGTFTAENYPLNNSVEKTMTDYENNVWFVSSRQGVMKLVKNNFTDVSDAAGIPECVVNTTCLYNGDLYIGTDSGLYIVGENNRQKSNDLTEMLKGVRIRCIITDSENKLWICSYSASGLLCYDGKECVSFNAENGLKSQKVRDVTELSDGTIAAATNGGVALIRNGKIEQFLDESSGIGSAEILTVCGGENGKIYLGSDGGGVFIVENGKAVKQIGLESGLKSEIVLRIKPDEKRGGYWIITGNSLAYMKDESVKTLANFPYSNNFDIFTNSSDEAWILSSSGIYVLNAEKLISGEEIEYAFYDMKCGIPAIATANSRSFLAEDGTLYIAGQTGVASVNINRRSENGSQIKLCVPYVDINDKRVLIKEGETLKIPANCKRLTIYSYALTFGFSNPHLSYCLEGFDSEKISVTRQDLQPISYTNLDSGEYTFKFSTMDITTGEPIATVSFKMEKEKPFFEQFWFWMLIVLGVLAVGMLVLLITTNIKNRRLVAKERENRLFVDQIIRAFAKCIDLKDTYTNGHSFRVARYTAMIAERMGYSKQQVEDIYNIGLLHDIGKIAVPDSILGKPSRLTSDEYEVIRHHAENGYQILKEIEIRPELAIGAGYHHEYYDGSGYPQGLKGDEIPEVAQIITVADTFDAMNSTRAYRKQMSKDDILAEMRKISGKQLNPKIVDVFFELVDEGKFNDVFYDDTDDSID